MVGREFNLGSPKQLQEILFDELELPKTKRIKTGYTTDADALTDLLRQDRAPAARAPAAPPRGGPAQDGRRRRCCRWSTTTAASTPRSTRRSPRPAGCRRTDPNLQNIPVRTAEGRRIREAFVVGAGYESLMTADYSQIEMRIMAHLSRRRRR